jgi:hypothetical protein
VLLLDQKRSPEDDSNSVYFLENQGFEALFSLSGDGKSSGSQGGVDFRPGPL